MKILISDNLSKVGVSMLKDSGFKIDLFTELSKEKIEKIIGNYQGLIIRSATDVNANLLEKATNLKVIGRAGVGLDNVDISAATKKGVVVMNTPGGNTITTAEHTVAMIMALSRKIPNATESVRLGKWEKKIFMGTELFGKTCGIIGFGNIGSNVAQRLKGLKMDIVVYEPNITDDIIEKAGFRSVELDELFRVSDYITVHVPKVESTKHLLRLENFEKMKDGVFIINCARGGIINENDLTKAIKSGKVAGAALDVFEEEPPTNNPLLSLKEVIFTPHLGASTSEAQENVAIAVAKQMIAYLKHNTVINAVNASSVTGELLKQISPFLNLAYKLGSCLEQLSLRAFKEVELNYSGDFFTSDKTPITIAFLEGLLAARVKERINSVNARVIAKQMGIQVCEKIKNDTTNYTNQITAIVKTENSVNSASGTIFGKNDPRIIRINDFRVEIIPKGHLLLIQNIDKPGAVGSIGTLLGEHRINIIRMEVGQDDAGKNTIVLLTTDKLISKNILDELEKLPLIISAKSLEL